MATAAEFLEILLHSDVFEDVVEAVNSDNIPLAEQIAQGVLIGAPAAIINQVIGYIFESNQPEELPHNTRPISLATEEESKDESLSDMPGRRNPSVFNMPNNQQRNRVAAARFAAQTQGSRGGMAGDEEVPVIPPPKRLALAAPDYFSVDLPYCVTSHRTNAKANQPIHWEFKCNSIFDPQTGTPFGNEHQPMGRDLWAGVYGYYRVLASTFTVTAVNYQANEAVTASSHPSFILGLAPQESVTETIVTREGLMESKISQWQILHPIETNHNSGSLTFNYTPEDWHYHVQETGIDERWTPIGSNPAIIHYITIFAANMKDGDVRALNAQFTVKMVFTVQFREANPTYIHQHDPQ